MPRRPIQTAEEATGSGIPVAKIRIKLIAFRFVKTTFGLSENQAFRQEQAK